MVLWAMTATTMVTTASTSATGKRAMLVRKRPADPMKGMMSRTALTGPRSIDRPIHIIRKPRKRTIQVFITCSPWSWAMACSWVPGTARKSLSFLSLRKATTVAPLRLPKRVTCWPGSTASYETRTSPSAG